MLIRIKKKEMHFVFDEYFERLVKILLFTFSLLLLCKKKHKNIICSYGKNSILVAGSGKEGFSIAWQRKNFVKAANNLSYFFSIKRSSRSKQNKIFDCCYPYILKESVFGDTLISKRRIYSKHLKNYLSAVAKDFYSNTTKPFYISKENVYFFLFLKLSSPLLYVPSRLSFLTSKKPIYFFCLSFSFKTRIQKNFLFNFDKNQCKFNNASDAHSKFCFKFGCFSKNKKTSTKLFGIPRLFSWISRTFPKITKDAVDVINQVKVNNLYLDMNGIIHLCTHGNCSNRSLSENEMLNRILVYIDRIYKFVMPTNLMVLCVDGVAPKAKINQQRMRRFKAARDIYGINNPINVEIANEIDLFDKNCNNEIINENKYLNDYKISTLNNDTQYSFTSNCITPGTEFMQKLNFTIRRWLLKKIRTDPVWQNGATIMYSGSDVFGEGEHKIMDLMRIYTENIVDTSLDEAKKNVCVGAVRKKNKLVDCIYGLDSDLIMLSLINSKHKNIFLLREKLSVVLNAVSKVNPLTGKMVRSRQDPILFSRKDFEMFHISQFRNALQQYFSNIVEGSLTRLNEINPNSECTINQTFISNNKGISEECRNDVKCIVHNNTDSRQSFAVTRESKLKKAVEKKNKIKIIESSKCKDSANNATSIDGLGNNLLVDDFNSGLPNASESLNLLQETSQNLETKVLLNTTNNNASSVNGLQNSREHNNIILLGKKSSNFTSFSSPRSSSSLSINATSSFDGVSSSYNASSSSCVNSSSEMSSLLNSSSPFEDRKQLINKVLQSMKTHRLIDDFVFLSFFVGTDFLPHLPHIHIAQGSLDSLLRVYVKIFSLHGGYITNKNKINHKRLQAYITELAKSEKNYFLSVNKVFQKVNKVTEANYKNLYYEEKFGWNEKEQNENKQQLIEKYLEGLFWMLEYYHNGCKSWGWEYPYHYAPLASDVTNISSIDLSIQKERPYNPLMQLISVLPPQEKHLLPSTFRNWISNSSNPISHYFPTNFTVDPNGKLSEYEYVIRLPFIDDNLLKKETQKYIDSIYSNLEHNKSKKVTQSNRKNVTMETSHSCNKIKNNNSLYDNNDLSSHSSPSFTLQDKLRNITGRWHVYFCPKRPFVHFYANLTKELNERRYI